MTLLGSTLLIYFLIGAGVAVAVYVSDMARTPAQRGFQTAACIVFWPLFLPVLLQRPTAHISPRTQSFSNGDELARAIHDVETELQVALHSADAAHDVQTSLDKLHAYWLAHAARIREM